MGGNRSGSDRRTVQLPEPVMCLKHAKLRCYHVSKFRLRPSLNAMNKRLVFVVAACGRITTLEVYEPPSWPVESGLTILLYELSSYSSSLHTFPFLVLDNFNGKSTSWFSLKSYPRGSVIIEWAECTELRFLNSGGPNTCIRWIDETTVNILWASSDMADKVFDKITEGVKTLSDSRYIHIILQTDKKTWAPSFPQHSQLPISYERKKWPSVTSCI